MKKFPTQLTIAGSPVATFTFYGLPSVNTHYNKHFRPRGIETNEWRLEAREEAKWWLWANNIDVSVEPLVSRALVVVKVWVPHTGIMDIHNEWIKAILDGFSDAGIWADDEWAFVPCVMNLWAGIGEFGPRQLRFKKTEIEIHELNRINYNGVHLRLPKGRRQVLDIDWDNFMGER